MVEWDRNYPRSEYIEDRRSDHGLTHIAQARRRARRIQQYWDKVFQHEHETHMRLAILQRNAGGISQPRKTRDTSLLGGENLGPSDDWGA